MAKASQKALLEQILHRLAELETTKVAVAPTVAATKTTLVQVGKHFIDPADVAAIAKVRDNLYVLRLKSQPNAEYPTWVKKKHLPALLEQFNLVVTDDGVEEEEEAPVQSNNPVIRRALK